MPIIMIEKEHADDIIHAKHKYITKEPDGKGGWRYYYYKRTKGDKGMTGDGALYEKTKGKPGSKYGTYKHTQGSYGTNDSKGNYVRVPEKTFIDKVEKTDKFFSSKTTKTTSDGKKVTTTYKVGELERAIDKGKNWIKKKLKKK